MTEPVNNPFQSPQPDGTEQHRKNVSVASEESTVDMSWNVALAAVAFTVISVGLMYMAQIIGL